MLRVGLIIIGVIFITVGTLGFIPDLISTKNSVRLLYETLAVNDIINWIHVLTGVGALIAAITRSTARMFCQIFGVIYAVVAVVGMFQGTNVLGLFQTNMPANLLHLILAAMLITLGFGTHAGAQQKTAI